MTHKKPHLPEKVCAACGRPFKWRRKWRQVWSEVKFCSSRCRKARSAPVPSAKASEMERE